MNTSKFKFILDLQRTQSQIAIPVTRGDTARCFRIGFSDGGLPYHIGSGCLAKIEIRRPTGTHLESFCPVENGATVVYDFAQNENTAAVEGIHDCAVVLYDTEGARIASPRFSMIVSDRVVDSDDINVSDEDVASIDAMLAAEAARQTSEKERINAEAARRNAEAEREDLESARRSAETLRAIAEAQRNGSEAERVSAENERRSAFLTYINENSLPSVTHADEGKTLSVKNGVWSVAEAGADARSLSASLDQQSYVMQLTLSDRHGNPLSTTEVDLPLESSVIGASEKNGTVTLTLRNGKTTSFYIGDLVDGLTSKQTHDEDIAALRAMIGENTLKEEDKDEIADSVVSILRGLPLIGTVSDHGVIRLKTALLDGAYTLVYEKADGTMSEVIAEFTVGEGTGSGSGVTLPAPDTALDWSFGVKIDSVTGAESASENYAASNHIDIVSGYVYTLTRDSKWYDCKICYYAGNGAFLSATSDNLFSVTGANLTAEVPIIEGASTFRIRAYSGDRFTDGYSDTLSLLSTVLTAQKG